MLATGLRRPRVRSRRHFDNRAEPFLFLDDCELSRFVIWQRLTNRDLVTAFVSRYYPQIEDHSLQFDGSSLFQEKCQSRCRIDVELSTICKRRNLLFIPQRAS
jgi:hypothetical protein